MSRHFGPIFIQFDLNPGQKKVTQDLILNVELILNPCLYIDIFDLIKSLNFVKFLAKKCSIRLIRGSTYTRVCTVIVEVAELPTNKTLSFS